MVGFTAAPGGRTSAAYWSAPNRSASSRDGRPRRVNNIHPDAPPFLLVHGTEDETVPFADAVGFAEALRAHGVRCDVLPVEGAGHVFTGASVEVGTLTEAGADFLDDVFNRSRLDAGRGDS